MFGAHPKVELVLILELQSTIVRGSLVFMKPGQPEVISTETVSIAHRPEMGSGDLIQATLTSIDQTLHSVHNFLHGTNVIPKNIPRKINSVHYVLSTPWAISQAKDISLSFDKDTTISKQFILGLINNERSRLAPDSAESEISVVEEKISEIRLNGYSVNDWEDKLAKNLEISFVVTVAGLLTVKLLKDACKHIINEHSIYFHSSLLLQFIALRKVTPNLESYILTHIHGELTDLSGILRNSSLFFGSYPMGSRTIIRGVAGESQTDEHAADSMLSLYTGKDLDTSFTNNTNTAVDIMSKKWTDNLKTLISRSNMPNSTTSLIIISSSAHEQFFIDSVKKDFPNTHIEPISMATIKEHIECNHESQSLRVLCLYAIAIHSIQNF